MNKKIKFIVLLCAAVCALSTSAMAQSTLYKLGDWGTGLYRNVYVKGNYAYCAGGDAGLDIIDVSNPYNPILAANIDTGGNVYNVFVSGNHAYVVDPETGLHIVRVSHPYSPVIVAQIEPSYLFTGVYVKDGIAYATSGTEGLYIFDVSNPAAPNPVPLAVLSGFGIAESVTVDGQYAYVATWTNGLTIVDVSNPSAPELKGVCDTPGQTWRVAVYEQSFAYVADGYSGVAVCDVRDPDHPFRVYQDTTDLLVNIDIEGDFAYLAGSGNIKVLDISNPQAPRTVAAVPGFSCGIGVVGDIAYAVGADRGLRLYDVSTPAYPQFTGAYDLLPGFTNGAAVQGDYAYLARGGKGLQILNIADPTAPFAVKTVDDDHLHNIYRLKVSGDYAYIPDAYEGLHIYQVNPPAAAGWRSTFTFEDGFTYDVEIDGNRAYVINQNEGFYILDITDADIPAQVGALETGGETWPSATLYDLVTDGDRAYVGCKKSGHYGVEILDIGTDETAPFSLGFVETPIPAYYLAAADGYLYVLGGYSFELSGLSVFSLADPDTPALVAELDVDGHGAALAVAGGTAYLGMYGDAGIRLVDVSDPASLQLTFSITTRANDVSDISVDGDQVYACDYGSGKFLIYEVVDPWAQWTWYYPGDLVIYNGVIYECTWYHYSQPGWEPDNPVLWAVWSPK